jgi:hypothetical protein
MSIASPDRGRFLVVMMSAHLARTKGLGTPVIDRAAFAPEELALLDDAIESASRSRAIIFVAEYERHIAKANAALKKASAA